MQIQIRSDSVIIDGYVNAAGRDSRPLRDKATGTRFVEQIRPGAFQRAIQRNEVTILLNHKTDRVLGSTETNLQLYEDAIGLRAHAEITDLEVIEKARNKSLRGWSFGFYELDASEEPMQNGLKRRVIEEMELEEISLIDETKVPCYSGTSIETRAEEKELIQADTIELRATYTEDVGKEEKREIDYSKYKDRIEKLEEEK